MQATTKKALGLLRKEFKQFDKGIQTHEPCVSAYEFEEISKKYEKCSLSLQSAQLQLDKLREDYLAKIQFSEKCEKEKNIYNHEMLKFKRETDACLKESTGLKREIEILKEEKSKACSELAKKSKELLKLEERVQSQGVKIKKLLVNTGPGKGIEIAMNEAIKEENNMIGTEEGYHYGVYPSSKKSIREHTAPIDARRPTRIISNASNSLEPSSSLYRGLAVNKSPYSSNSSLGSDDRIPYKDNSSVTKYNYKNKEEFKDIIKPMSIINENIPGHIDQNLEYQEKTYNKDTFISQISTKKKKNTNKSNKSNKSDKKSPKKETITTQVTNDTNKRTVESKIKIIIKDENNEITDNREIIRDGKVIKLIDKANNTISNIKATVSVAIQFNWEQPEDVTENTKESGSLFLLHFNPNNVYGLMGDIFYNSHAKVFAAHSKTSGLSTDIFSQYN